MQRLGVKRMKADKRTGRRQHADRQETTEDFVAALNAALTPRQESRSPPARMSPGLRLIQEDCGNGTGDFLKGL